MKSLIRVLISVAFLVATVVGGLLFVWPTYEEYSTLSKSIAEQRDRLERGESVLARLKQADKQIQDHSADFDKIKLAIPEDKAVPGVYDLIQEMASLSGLVLQSVDAKTVPDGDAELMRTNLNFTFEGSYAGLKNFLLAVRTSNRILNLNSLSVSTSSQSTQSPGALQIQIGLTTYSYE